MAKQSPSKLPKPDRFNPLDPAAIGAILRERLEQEESHDFPPDPFRGAGLYALYYVGDGIPEYQPLANEFRQGRHIPVYVGKAESGNSSYGFEPDYNATNLSDRIAKHADSVAEVERFNGGGNLRLVDFRVKFLSIDDAWIVLGERALLRAYRPVLWNSIVNGFGSNPPGTARKNARSVWDTMHPGRERAGQLPNRRLTLAEIRDRVAEGVEISLIRKDDVRDKRIAAMKRTKVIWSPPSGKSTDKRIHVADERRFLAEIERLGLSVPEYRTNSADEFSLFGER
ncbi:Eco29kI restriction endonuclease [Saccharomonospora marina XMU15]|uniref:Eco29kI restriction endonuclease n=1 Tax=Saccharomonospora marina XMU15 TaxID=882083 RepID=H5X381_9PSEU|nr:Eco29kI family restriction endonuclease [Saccharomonospora marina]EHR48750.1 Eco29kI restriction endonuclease [Saccharomonospora marina XMU15]